MCERRNYCLALSVADAVPSVFLINSMAFVDGLIEYSFYEGEFILGS